MTGLPPGNDSHEHAAACVECGEPMAGITHACPPLPRGLPPLDAEGVLWVAALELVPIEKRIETVARLKEQVEEINAHRASYFDDPPGAGWQE